MTPEITLRRLATFTSGYGRTPVERQHQQAVVSLAAHAALPVVLNADLLHLLRLNFLPRLPYTAEAYVLLSPLCSEIGSGLYAMSPPIRTVLLRQLVREEGPLRLAEIATLLWQYSRKHAPWINEEGLEKAQELTALNFLDPLAAHAWLEAAEARVTTGESSMPPAWYVAMRQEMTYGEQVALLTSEREPELVSQGYVNSLGVEFVLIPAGTFFMGSNYGYRHERPVHRVQISQSFYLGKYPITQGQWTAVMGSNPSRFPGDPNRPVENVSWEGVQSFLRRLNALEPSSLYRLPTEAEWEYAARAGSTTEYSFGNDVEQLPAYAWYAENAKYTTQPVGRLRPNARGLYDIHGNVWEWVQDWYGPYTAASAVDPRGPTSGFAHAVRGGGWFNGARNCRLASRGYTISGPQGYILGLRLLRTAQ